LPVLATFFISLKKYLKGFLFVLVFSNILVHVFCVDISLQLRSTVAHYTFRLF
jgi:hypothetical protein